MITIIYNTFYIDNLRFSLKYLSKVNYEYNLIIHNDNPDVILTEEFLKEFCELETLKYNNLILINQQENKGMLFSRIEAFKYIYNDTEYVLYMDDDDLLLIYDLPEFSEFMCYRYNAYFVKKYRELYSILTNKPLPNIETRLVHSIHAIFWKKDLLKIVFDTIENNKPDFRINTSEDYVILSLAAHIAFINDIKFVKNLDKIGMIYNDIESTYNRYSHISDTRYNIDADKSYDKNILNYIILLKSKINENKLCNLNT